MIRHYFLAAILLIAGMAFWVGCSSQMKTKVESVNAENPNTSKNVEPASVSRRQPTSSSPFNQQDEGSSRPISDPGRAERGPDPRPSSPRDRPSLREAPESDGTDREREALP